SWASNSRYAFLGALRSAAQMVSYEVAIGFVLVTVLLCAGSLNLTDIVLAQERVPVWHAYVWPLLPMAVIFFVSGLAETNRAPFDLPEGESELVAGYFVEYSAMAFALFFLGEYGNMILVSGMTTILFLGGWLPPFSIPPFTWLSAPIWFLLKTVFVMFCILWVRATCFSARSRSITPMKRARSARGFAASMRSGGIPMARSAVSPASCARRSARLWRSRSRPSHARMAAGAPPATTST